MSDYRERSAVINRIRENFPSTRFSERRWVCWKIDENGQKVPVNPNTGGNAMSNSPSTWATFDKAAEYYVETGTDKNGTPLEGPGIMFSEDDPDAGVDLDDCLDGQGKSKLAKKVLDLTDTYTEVSPSGTGLKLYGTGTLVEAITPKDSGGEFEAYDSGRWFAVTGRRLDGAPKEIRDIQDVLTRATKTYKAKKSSGEYRPPLNVADILNGVPEGERDNKIYSLACRLRRDDIPIDIALASVERAALNSCFPVDVAKEKVTRAYKKFSPEPQIPQKNGRKNGHVGLPVEELPDEEVEAILDGTPGLLGRRFVGKAIEEGIEPPDMIFEGYLYAAKIHSWTGEAGHGKTILAQWASLELMKAGHTVLYLDEEGSLSQVAERLEAMGATPELLDEYFYYFQSPGVTLNYDDRRRLMESVREIEPSLVVFDSWVDFLAIEGLDENNSIDVTKWVKLIAYPIRDAGASVLLLDHVNKDNFGRGGRGSTAKLAKLDASFRLTQTEEFDRESMGKVTLKREKDREAFLKGKTEFAIGGKDGRLIVKADSSIIHPERNDELNSYDRSVLASLSATGMRSNEWMRAANVSGKNKFLKTRKKLVRLGHVEVINSDEYPLYRRPESGPEGSNGVVRSVSNEGGPASGESGPASNGSNRSNPADNQWSGGPRTSNGPVGTGGEDWSGPVRPPIGGRTTRTTPNPGPHGLVEMKKKALAVIDAMKVGTFEEPTYRRPHDFHAALAEKLGLTQSEVENLVELIDGDFDWWGLYGLYTQEEMDSR